VALCGHQSGMVLAYSGCHGVMQGFVHAKELASSVLCEAGAHRTVAGSFTRVYLDMAIYGYRRLSCV